MNKKNIVRMVIATLIAIGLILIISMPAVAAASNDSPILSQNLSTTSSEENIPSETTENEIILFQERKIVETQDKDELLKLIQKCKDDKLAAHNMAESARKLGYAEDHPVIVLAQLEWNSANDAEKEYIHTYEEITKAEVSEQKAIQMKEYPTATTVWYYLHDTLGYNDYICAGIIGNMMAEVGGQTLALQGTISDNGYYGLCQWNTAYKSQVWGKSVEDQLIFLGESIQSEFDVFGKVYKSGFNFDQFLELENEKDAALAFAKCYERCGSGSYSIRQKNATIALNYFTAPLVEKEDSDFSISCDLLYTSSQFKRAGVINFNGYRWTWYSQKVLPGGGLKIPGRHVDENNYVCDENGYICLASQNHSKGTVLNTPLGKQGKVYDYCDTPGTVDVYVNF